MKKIISKEGISFFYEIADDDVKCIAYETNKPMSGSDIANKLNISRSAVSQSLRRSITRIYSILKNRYRISSPIEIMCIMVDMFNIKTETEYKKFFKLFPNDIKDVINERAKEAGY